MTSEFRIDARFRVDPTTPFWHRAEPAVRVLPVDPGFAELRRVFPTTWRALVAVKSRLDGLAMLTSFPSAVNGGRVAGSAGSAGSGWLDGGRDHLVRQVAGEAAAILRAATSGERSSGRGRLADSVDRQAENLRGYADTGEWSPYLVDPPARDEPWIYCGPLSTWAPRETDMPLGLLVVRPEPDWQRSVDLVDEHLDAVRDAAAQAVGAPVCSTSATPAMFVGTLLLAGGEPSFGHKNFAHFFPLEAPGGAVAGVSFTLVFGNVHRARLAGCSLPLLDAFLGRSPGGSGFGVDDVLAASLTWFRCHDLGHFWRNGRIPAPDSGLASGSTSGSDAGSGAPTLNGFVSMALEETYADMMGALCARRVIDPGPLNVAFGAELLRYLSRSMVDFADSVAAAVEVGWFARAGLAMPSESPTWLDTETGATLIRTVHAALWSRTDPAAAVELRDCLPAGRRLVERLGPLHASHPTDLVYTFG
ncbi:MAG TPA: hypothetical protein VFX70_21655 [Mycobacteriales bacterium]|nr:hypothetical protein [Mycobacteriales bacterium]